MHDNDEDDVDDDDDTPTRPDDDSDDNWYALVQGRMGWKLLLLSAGLTLNISPG